MLRLITGPNGSGKSVFAENLLEQVSGRKRYFATLPNLAQNADRIERHRLRRSANWIVHELTGFLNDDLTCVRACAQDRSAVLFDGFSIYLQRLVLFESAERAATLVRRLSRVIAYLASVCPEVIVVDCLSQETEEQGAELLQAVANIASAAGELLLFDERGLREVISRGDHGGR